MASNFSSSSLAASGIATRGSNGINKQISGSYVATNDREEEEEEEEEDVDVVIGQVAPMRKKMEKAKWTAQEDAILKDAVETHEGKNWKQISSYLDGKTEVQCLHRWTKVLNPTLTKGPWTEEVLKL